MNPFLAPLPRPPPQAIDSGKEREELFEDWVVEREKAAKEAKRAEKKRRRTAFRELLERSRWGAPISSPQAGRDGTLVGFPHGMLPGCSWDNSQAQWVGRAGGRAGRRAGGRAGVACC